MASNTFPTTQLGAELFEILNDNASLARPSVPLLPSGACNFVDLAPGASASKCGCRRFWARQNQGSSAMDQCGWCMCNHHACYHDEGTRDLQSTGFETERPQTGRNPSSQLQDMSIKAASLILPPPPFMHRAEFPSFSGASQLSFLRRSLDGGLANLVDAAATSPQPGSSMPDTLGWADLIQPQADASPASHALPPIPPQCLMPSQATSTTSSMQARYMRPFAGRGLETLNAAAAADLSTEQAPPAPSAKPPTLPTPTSQSAMAIPGTEESFVFVTPDEGDPPARPGTASTQDEPRASASTEHASREEARNLTDIVNTHAQRLDRLEAGSILGANQEECLERHDQLDLRVAELESKIEEVEKLVLGNEAASNRDTDRQDDDATTVSIVSAGSNATSRISHGRSQEIFSQLQCLQAQVSQLQSVMPSPNHLWELEVVFLPFPLRRVWQHIDQFRDAAMGNGDDWTQLPMTHSTSAPAGFSSSQPLFGGEWTVQDHDMEWLLPRACGDKSVTDRRLRSRGLVKKLSVGGPDARSVQVAMNAAFGDVFRDMQMHARPHGANPRMSKFMGLQSPWVPLRKMHRDSRLRFLSPDEMLTPSLWTVQFLHSVMMRATEPRLFVTHPDAYLQDYQAYETGWSWQRLRETASGCPDVTESQEAPPETEETEECWAWNEQLDAAPLHAPVAPAESRRQERQRVSISPSISYFPAGPLLRSMSPLATRNPGSTTLLSRIESSRPFPRMSSVPPGVAAQGTAPSFTSSTAKRRVVSHSQSRRTTPMTQATALSGGIVKRRRTRSPSHGRFTPRLTSSPSPMPMSMYERQAVRTTTPFTYATPHSNAPLQEMRPVRGSSVVHTGPEFATSDIDEEDEDYDMHMCDSGSDDSFGDDGDEDGDGDEEEEEDNDTQVVTTARPPSSSSHHQYNRSFRLPEDEPRPGIEEDGSDGENMEPEGDESETNSSQPSEYPITKSAWPEEAGGFHIHEDDDDDL